MLVQYLDREAETRGNREGMQESRETDRSREIERERADSRMNHFRVINRKARLTDANSSK